MYWFPVEWHSYLPGSPGLFGVYMLHHRVARNNNWIFIYFSAIICSIKPGFFTIISDIFNSFCLFKLFSMDLSRLVWFWLSHVLVMRLTCLSVGFMTCFDFFLIRTELCSWATSNNFCLFEQLSLSSLFSASRIPILLWNSLSWELTKLIGWGEQRGSLSVFIILAGVGV